MELELNLAKRLYEILSKSHFLFKGIKNGY